MNILLGTTLVCYSIILVIVLQRIVAVRQGKIGPILVPRSRAYSYIEKITDIVAYNMVVFVQEFIWHSYVYLVKLVRFGLRFSRKWLHRIEKWFTRMVKKADSRNRNLGL